MLADLVLPLIALAVALLPIAPASPSPEVPMPPLDDVDDADAATLGGPTPTADPVAVPDSPPPPGATNPDTGTDDGTGPTAVPTPPPTETDPVPPAGPKQVAVRDLIARGPATDKRVESLKAQQSEVASHLATALDDQVKNDRLISSVVGDHPDGYYITDPDGKLVVYTKTSSGRGYNLTYPLPGDTMVDDPDAAS